MEKIKKINAGAFAWGFLFGVLAIYVIIKLLF